MSVVVPFRSRESRRPIAAALCEAQAHFEGAALMWMRTQSAWCRVLIRTWWGV